MPIALHQKHDDSCKPVECAARAEFTKDSSSAALPFTADPGGYYPRLSGSLSADTDHCRASISFYNDITLFCVCQDFFVNSFFLSVVYNFI